MKTTRMLCEHEKLPNPATITWSGSPGSGPRAAMSEKITPITVSAPSALLRLKGEPQKLLDLWCKIASAYCDLIARKKELESIIARALRQDAKPADIEAEIQLRLKQAMAEDGYQAAERARVWRMLHGVGVGDGDCTTDTDSHSGVYQQPISILLHAQVCLPFRFCGSYLCWCGSQGSTIDATAGLDLPFTIKDCPGPYRVQIRANLHGIGFNV